MNKIISLSLALISFSATSFAEGKKPQTPKLDLKGHASGALYFFNQKDRSYGKGYGTAARIEDALLKFDVNGYYKAFGGLDYSLLVSLSADKAETETIKETRLMLKGKLGTIKFGTTNGPEKDTITGSSVLSAREGYDGSLTDIVNVSSGVVWDTGHVGSSNKAVKIIYSTPRVGGIKASIGFAPSSQQKGGEKLKTRGGQEHSSQSIVSGLISYKRDYEGGRSELTLSGVAGRSNSLYGSKEKYLNKVGDIRSWSVGTKIGYGDVDVAIGYVNNLGTQVDKTHVKGAHGGHVITTGVGCKCGDHKFGLGWYHSDKKLGTMKKEITGERGVLLSPAVDTNLGHGRANVYSLTYDYKIASGLNLFAEANYFNQKTTKEAVELQMATHKKKDKAAKPVGSNKGHVFLIGTKINF